MSLKWYDGIRVDLTDVRDGRQDVVLVLARRGDARRQVALQMPLAEARAFHAAFADALAEAEGNNQSDAPGIILQ